MARKISYHGRCPICGRKYNEHLEETGHHVFPKYWYRGQGPKVPVCRECHNDFNVMFPMGNGKHVWSLFQCLSKWYKFCKVKGKEMLIIYPQLESYTRELGLPLAG